MKLSELFEATGDPFPYYPGFVHRFGISVNACVLLCYVGWKTKPDTDGWSQLNMKDIRQTTGLSVKEQTTARKALVKAGLLEDRYARLDHKLKLRLANVELDAGQPADAPNDGANGQTPKGQMPLGHTPKGQMAMRQTGVSSNWSNKGVKEGADAPAAAEMPKGPLTLFREWWAPAFLAAHGRPYITTAYGADGAQAKALFAAGVTVEQLIACVKRAWKHPDWFWCKNAVTIKYVAAKYNEILNELEHPPVEKVNGKARPVYKSPEEQLDAEWGTGNL